MSVGFIASLQIYSTQKILQSQADKYAGVHIYQDKTATIDQDALSIAKRKYVEGRGFSWLLTNKRTDKIKDTLAELEDLLAGQYIAGIGWQSLKNFQLVLSNGVIVDVLLNTDTCDIDKLAIDRSLTNRINGYISHGLVHEKCMVLAMRDKPQLMMLNYSRKQRSDSKVFSIDIPGSSEDLAKRHIVANVNFDTVCVWWKNLSDDVRPQKREDNIAVFTLVAVAGVYSLELLNYVSSDVHLIDVQFSNVTPHQLLSVEQVAHGKKTIVNTFIYEMTTKKVKKIAATSFLIQGAIISLARNLNQTKIAVLTSEGKLILRDDLALSEKTIHLYLTGSMISWHPSDLIFAVASAKGEIQVFDQALNALSISLVADDQGLCDNTLKLYKFFFSAPKLIKMSWTVDMAFSTHAQQTCCSDDLLLFFDRGPMCMLRVELGVCNAGVLGPVQLVCHYLNHQHFYQATTLLGSLDWESLGDECFQSLCLICEQLFKQPFDEHIEGLLEDTLGVFYAPSRPLQESVILLYRDDVSRIARKFFHMLLRHKRFEKAYLLAVDIGSKDLFMVNSGGPIILTCCSFLLMLQFYYDIHYMAVEAHDKSLAEASYKRAYDLHQYGIARPWNGLSISQNDTSDSTKEDGSKLDKYKQHDGRKTRRASVSQRNAKRVQRSHKNIESSSDVQFIEFGDV